MRRRDFLLLTGSVGAAAALDSVFNLVGSAASVDAAPDVMPGIESRTMTTCLMCPGGCGVRVRSVDGHPVGISGNPNHPLNAGGVCTEGIASLQMLYHPDRLLRPMRRNNGAGADRFEAVSWNVALEEVAGVMKKIRQGGGSGKLAFVLGRTGGSMEALVRHFMSAWGSPNLYLDEIRDGIDEVFEVMHGLRARPAFDFDNADFVLSFGADLLNGWQSPLQFQRSFATFQSPARNPKARLIVADTRYSHTAAQASEWVGMAPGSSGALALGIAYVMLREKLYDIEFAQQQLYGFEDLEVGGGTGTGYRNLVLKDYSPEVVSRLTGVPVETILELGKAFGESQNALALFDENVTAQPGGLHAAMAIHSLNLLKGNINKPGGIYLQPRVPLNPLAPAPGGQPSSSRPRVIEDLADIASSTDVPDILFLYYSNPVYSSSFGPRIRELLQRIGLVVSFTPFLDETSRFAHYILPDAMPLERWEDRVFPSSFPVGGWGVAQPCIKPAGEVRHSGDVILQLTQRLGGDLAEALPWKDFEELLKHRARGLHGAHAGSLCVEPFHQGLVGEMERRGWWMSDDEDFDEFWKKLLAAGAWADLNYRVRSLAEYSGHPDGKIDLYSRALRDGLSRSGALSSEIECLPHYHAENPSHSLDHPMVLNPFRAGKRGSGTHGILPWILQNGDPGGKLAWNSWAEISAPDAASRQIRTGDWIWVESATGRLKVRAIVHPGAGPGVVSIPSGFGHREMGRWAQGRGVNPMEILAPERDRLTGLPNRFGTRVRIQKA